MYSPSLLTSSFISIIEYEALLTQENIERAPENYQQRIRVVPLGLHHLEHVEAQGWQLETYPTLNPETLKPPESSGV